MIVKIFWQEGCPHCPTAKNLGRDLESSGVKVEYYDIKSIDGLAEATFFSIMSTPSVVVTTDNNESKIWKGKIPEMEELNNVLLK